MRLFYWFRISIITSTTLALAACFTASTSTVSKNPVAVPTELYTAPIEKAANDTHNTLTQSTPPATASFNQLTDIDQNLNKGAYAIAQQKLAQLPPTFTENLALKTNVIILQTKLQLLAGNPAQALTWLNQLPPSLALNATQQNYLLQLRSQALYRTNHVLLSTLADIQNHTDTLSIWHKLLLVDATTLQTQTTLQTSPIQKGWLMLADIAQRNANDFTLLKNNIVTWQQTYPQHPANQLLPSLQAAVPADPQSIAVILPLSGNYANFGQTVQQGILAAYYASPTSAHQQIAFYDSSADSIQAIYQQIKTQGHTLILGPLTKENTEALLRIADASPRIISLNYTAVNSPSSHLEFGLSPENEAQQIAKLAWRKSKSSAIIITPRTEKGQQSADAFIQTWTALGGQVVDRYDYLNHEDFSKSMRTLFGVTDSQWRQHLLHNTLHLRTTATSYFRKDADMVFLVATPNTARQIRPFIKFYTGDYLSVFATSSVYAGRYDPSHDKDLNEVYFCDMPAILNVTQAEKDRLYFLGKDVYLLAMQQAHLDTLPLFPIVGATGHLSVNTTTHDIQRELTCAQFKEGRPTLLNSTNQRSGN